MKHSRSIFLKLQELEHLKAFAYVTIEFKDKEQMSLYMTSLDFLIAFMQKELKAAELIEAKKD